MENSFEEINESNLKGEYELYLYLADLLSDLCIRIGCEGTF